MSNYSLNYTPAVRLKEEIHQNPFSGEDPGRRLVTAVGVQARLPESNRDVTLDL